jgi:hypothetical protein
MNWYGAGHTLLSGAAVWPAPYQCRSAVLPLAAVRVAKAFGGCVAICLISLTMLKIFFTKFRFNLYLFSA